MKKSGPIFSSSSFSSFRPTLYGLKTRTVSHNGEVRKIAFTNKGYSVSHFLYTGEIWESWGNK